MTAQCGCISSYLIERVGEMAGVIEPGSVPDVLAA
jgi:hypothetical protein